MASFSKALMYISYTLDVLLSEIENLKASF